MEACKSKYFGDLFARPIYHHDYVNRLEHLFKTHGRATLLAVKARRGIHLKILLFARTGFQWLARWAFVSIAQTIVWKRRKIETSQRPAVPQFRPSCHTSSCASWGPSLAEAVPAAKFSRAVESISGSNE